MPSSGALVFLVGRRTSPWQGYVAMLLSLRKAGEALSYFKVRLETAY